MRLLGRESIAQCSKDSNATLLSRAICRAYLDMVYRSIFSSLKDNEMSGVTGNKRSFIRTQLLNRAFSGDTD